MKKRIYAAINKIEGIIGILALLYYVVCLGMGMSVRGILFVWLIGGLALAVKSVLVHRILKKCAFKKKQKTASVAFSVIFWAWALSVLLFCIPVISHMRKIPPKNLDYIVVLGARVLEDGTPSKALESRIDTAYAYLMENPETIAVATGGQGTKEPVSESVCIKRELVARGIDENRILTEEASSTTVENFRFSKALLPKQATVGVVTNNFHMYRSTLTAQKYLEQEVSALPAPFSGVLLPHYMLREFITFLVDTVRGNL